MGTGGGADAVHRVLILPGVGHERGVHGLLQRLQAEADGDHVRAQQLHAGDVGGLLGDVHLAHVDVARHAEVGRRGGQGHAMLARARLGDQLLLAHVLGQQPLAHAVVQLVGPGVVQVLALEVDLRPPQQVGEVLAVVNRRGPPLEIPADAPQLGDELGRLGDGVVGLGVFVEGLDQLRILKVVSAVFPEIAVRGRILLQVVVEIPVLVQAVGPLSVLHECSFYSWAVAVAVAAPVAVTFTVLISRLSRKISKRSVAL